jgi:4-hydroxy-4-methyl-2-oxoglutarate aldolase
MNQDSLPPAVLEQLRGLSTCVAASAIECFGVRLPNVGFTDASVKCMFPDLPAIVGYAVTARIRSATPPMEGGSYYYWRADWWKQILKVPAPRIVVLEDLDHPPGLGAFAGGVHANILKALGCTALLTNGAVRDLPEARSIGFQLFAGNISVSHGYAHLASFGDMVEVGHLKIKPGELLLGDLHGVVSIPLEIAERIPGVAQGITERRQYLIDLCRTEGFTLERLEAGRRELGIMEKREREMQDVNPKRGKS